MITYFSGILLKKRLGSAMPLAFIIALFFVSFFIIPTTPARAQEIPDVLGQAAALGFDDLSAPSVDLDVSSSGTPGSTAIIRARTANIDDNTSIFDWYLDDQPMLFASGRAKTDFSFQTTRPFHVVRITVSSEGRVVAENAASVQSFAVALTWVTDTFVPADYAGKALPSVGSRITVTAFPSMRNETPDGLLYTWYVDAESQVRNVLGEQEFSIVASKNTSFVSIMVEISNLSQSITVSKAVVIPLAKPMVIVNNNTPLFLIPGKAAEITAQPFYFHIANINGLSFQWIFGGKTITGTPPNPHELTLIIPEDSGSGLQYLRVEAHNNTVLGERARSDLPITIF